MVLNPRCFVYFSTRRSAYLFSSSLNWGGESLCKRRLSTYIYCL